MRDSILQIAHWNVLHAFGKEPFAIVAGQLQYIQHGSFLHITQPRRAAFIGDAYNSPL